MLYHYLASDKNEHLIEGDLDAENVEQVLQSIASRDLRPVSVTQLEGKKNGIRLFEGKITTEDKVFLTRYLSLMLRVGTDLLSAINILIADFECCVGNSEFDVLQSVSKLSDGTLSGVIHYETCVT